LTNADWWARVVQARAAREDLLPQRVWALRKGEHEAAMPILKAAEFKEPDALGEATLAIHVAGLRPGLAVRVRIGHPLED
jgi:hypothetical protein